MDNKVNKVRDNRVKIAFDDRVKTACDILYTHIEDFCDEDANIIMDFINDMDARNYPPFNISERTSTILKAMKKVSVSCDDDTARSLRPIIYYLGSTDE